MAVADPDDITLLQRHCSNNQPSFVPLRVETSLNMISSTLSFRFKVLMSGLELRCSVREKCGSTCERDICVKCVCLAQCYATKLTPTYWHTLPLAANGYVFPV